MVTGIQKSTTSYCTRFIFNLIHAWQCAQFWVHQTELQLFTEDSYPPKIVALLHHISRRPGVAGASGSAACATWVTTWWGARGRGSRGDRWSVQGGCGECGTIGQLERGPLTAALGWSRSTLIKWRPSTVRRSAPYCNSVSPEVHTTSGLRSCSSGRLVFWNINEVPAYESCLKLKTTNSTMC